MKKILLFLSALTLASASYSQVIAGSSFFNEIVSDWHMGFTLDTTGSAMLPTDIKDSHANLSIYEATGLIKFQAIHKEKHVLNVDAGYKYSYFDFSQNAPFDELDKFFGRLFYSMKIDENWSVYGMGVGYFSSEKFSNMNTAGQCLAGLGVGYQFNESLRLGLGAAAYSRMDRNWGAIPIGYLDWQITKQLSLRAFSGAALIYDVFADGTLLINFSFEYENSYSRLSNINGLDHSVRDSYYQIAFGATYKMQSGWYVSASAAGNFNRELQFRTAGNKSEFIEIDAAPVLYLHLGYLF